MTKEEKFGKREKWTLIKIGLNRRKIRRHRVGSVEFATLSGGGVVEDGGERERDSSSGGVIQDFLSVPNTVVLLTRI